MNVTSVSGLGVLFALIICILVLLFIIYIIGGKLQKYSLEQMKCKDERGKLMTEILLGMKVSLVRPRPMTKISVILLRDLRSSLQGYH